MSLYLPVAAEIHFKVIYDQNISQIYIVIIRFIINTLCENPERKIRFQKKVDSV